MATKGTAAKSASGAAMSKYDVEVESRLQALESKSTAAPVIGGSDYDRLAEVEKKLDLLYKIVAELDSGFPNLVKKFGG
jgi:translation elongation factor EF-Tu-like GTPase|tara:strand:+ start:147 stop:383 length:237 start_codon:yes stop_codon:yes gene_type:complete